MNAARPTALESAVETLPPGCFALVLTGWRLIVWCVRVREDFMSRATASSSTGAR